MALCFLGFHSWDGCRCSKCAKARDAQHSWNGHRCSKCDADIVELLVNKLEKGNEEGARRLLSDWPEDGRSAIREQAQSVLITKLSETCSNAHDEIQKMSLTLSAILTGTTEACRTSPPDIRQEVIVQLAMDFSKKKWPEHQGKFFAISTVVARLGELHATSAVDDLVAILRMCVLHTYSFRAREDDVRIYDGPFFTALVEMGVAAATALGRIGDGGSRKILDAIAHRRFVTGYAFTRGQNAEVDKTINWMSLPDGTDRFSEPRIMDAARKSLSQLRPI